MISVSVIKGHPTEFHSLKCFSMHFPFDHSSHFICICTNSMSEVGKNTGNTICGIVLVQREGRALEEGTLPFPASEHSFTLSLLCPVQHHFTCGPALLDIVSLLIHILSALNTNIQPRQWEQHFRGMQCPGFTSHRLG